MGQKRAVEPCKHLQAILSIVSSHSQVNIHIGLCTMKILKLVFDKENVVIIEDLFKVCIDSGL